MRSSIVHGLAAMAFLFAAAAPVLAQDDNQQQQVRAACMPDYKRFCMGVMPGGGRILACLGQHTAELSPPCAAAISVGMQCAEDYKKFCPNVSRGNGEVKRCLQQHLTSLSEGCAHIVSASMTAK